MYQTSRACGSNAGCENARLPASSTCPPRRRHEVADLARVRGSRMSKTRSPEFRNEQATISGSTCARHRAVVRAVAQRLARAARSGSSRGRRVRRRACSPPGAGRRRSRGCAGSAMSMSRAAPTWSSTVAGLKRNANSSNSSRYGWPSIVSGTVFCGIETVSQVMRLISRTCGSGLRSCTSATSRIAEVAVDRIGLEQRLAVGAEVQPVASSRCRTRRCTGSLGFVTSTAVMCPRPRPSQNVLPSGEKPLSCPNVRRRHRTAAPGGGSRRARRRVEGARRASAPLPTSAPSSPRARLRFSDSCGDNIPGAVSVAVCTGWAGSAMSSTTTPGRRPPRGTRGFPASRARCRRTRRRDRCDRRSARRGSRRAWRCAPSARCCTSSRRRPLRVDAPAGRGPACLRAARSPAPHVARAARARARARWIVWTGAIGGGLPAEPEQRLQVVGRKRRPGDLRQQPRHDQRPHARKLHADVEGQRDAVADGPDTWRAGCGSRPRTPCRCRAMSARGSRRSARSRPSRRPARRCPAGPPAARSAASARRGRGVQALVDLEVHVRPAAAVGRGEDRFERELPVRVGLLHAPQ